VSHRAAAARRDVHTVARSGRKSRADAELFHPVRCFREGRVVTDLASPRATRLSLPRWLDARVVLGVLLMLVSIVGGARVFASAGQLTGVYAAAHDLVPGARIGPGDLTVTRVRLDGDGGKYVAAGGAAPVGYVVTRFVGGDELVPSAALATAPPHPTRLVTLPVQPGHLPDDLGRGDLVDVYLTPKAAAGAQVPMPSLVLSSVPVDDRDGGSRTFGGDSSLAVVLAVPADRVRDVVHAVESGTIDLVRVPTQ
jgi:hypothetical protein